MLDPFSDPFHDIDSMVEGNLVVSPNLSALWDITQENILGATSSLSYDKEEILEREGETETFILI